MALGNGTAPAAALVLRVHAWLKTEEDEPEFAPEGGVPRAGPRNVRWMRFCRLFRESEAHRVISADSAAGVFGVGRPNWSEP